MLYIYKYTLTYSRGIFLRMPNKPKICCACTLGQKNNNNNQALSRHKQFAKCLPPLIYDMNQSSSTIISLLVGQKLLCYWKNWWSYHMLLTSRQNKYFLGWKLKRPAVLNCMQKYWRLSSNFFILSRKKMGSGFLVDQIYLVSSGNYDPHAKNLRVFLVFLFTELYWTALQNRRSFCPNSFVWLSKKYFLVQINCA